VHRDGEQRERHDLLLSSLPVSCLGSFETRTVGPSRCASPVGAPGPLRRRRPRALAAAGDREGPAIGQEVVRRCRERIAEECGRSVTAALRMNVCLVFDEAGALDLGRGCC
jgi:hypothetical protein